MSVPVQLPPNFKSIDECAAKFPDMDPAVRNDLCSEIMNLDKDVDSLWVIITNTIKRLKEQIAVQKSQMENASGASASEMKQHKDEITKLQTQVNTLNDALKKTGITMKETIERSKKRLRLDEAGKWASREDFPDSFPVMPLVNLGKSQTMNWNALAMQENPLDRYYNYFKENENELMNALEKLSNEQKLKWFGGKDYRTVEKTPNNILYMAFAALEPNFERFQKWLESVNVPPLTDHGVDVLYGVVQVMDTLKKLLQQGKSIEGGVGKPYYLYIIEDQLRKIGEVFPSFFMPITPQDWIAFVYDENNPVPFKIQLIDVLVENVETYLERFPHYQRIQVQDYKTPLQLEVERFSGSLEDGIGRIVYWDSNENNFMVIGHKKQSGYGKDEIVKVNPYRAWDSQGFILNDKGERIIVDGTPLKIDLDLWVKTAKDIEDDAEQEMREELDMPRVKDPERIARFEEGQDPSQMQI